MKLLQQTHKQNEFCKTAAVTKLHKTRQEATDVYASALFTTFGLVNDLDLSTSVCLKLQNYQ